jgi:hypothetical protein
MLQVPFVKQGPPTVPLAFELLPHPPSAAAVNVTPNVTPSTPRKSRIMVPRP